MSHTSKSSVSPRGISGLCSAFLIAACLSQGGSVASAARTSPIVKPGALISIAGAHVCTMNFVFQGSDGRTYVGTAGHCVFRESQGFNTWKPGEGAIASDENGSRFGEMAYAALDGMKLDFALVRIDRKVTPDPQMYSFGGPTGMFRGTTSSPGLANIYGRGAIVEDVAPARTFVVPFGYTDPKNTAAVGVVTGGDSGAPTITEDGKALGVAVALGVGFSQPGEPSNAGNTFIVRLPHQLKVAEEALGIKLRLLTAPLS